MLLREYVLAVMLKKENVNVYTNGHRVYTRGGGGWRRAKIGEAVQTWASSIYSKFLKFLRTNESEVRSLSHGDAKWSRICDIYFGEDVLRYCGRSREKMFNAMELLRAASSQNGHLRIRRST